MKAGLTVPPQTVRLTKGTIFATLTNVNFDRGRFYTMAMAIDKATQELREMVLKARPDLAPKETPLAWFDRGHPISYTLQGALRHSRM